MIQKRAFSLIEVLLVMGIIAVVTAMGFSISKKGAERAYNLYWYTGYSALYDGTADAWDKGVISANNYNLAKYATHICTLVRAENCNGTSFMAPNGISFDMSQPANYFKIEMTIPKPKTMRNFPNKTVFVYNYSLDSNGGMVYPSAFSDQYTLNLQNRADLLPFYIKPSSNDIVNHFHSFREAYCTVNENHAYVNDVNTNISCTPQVSIISPHNAEIGGVIHPINPKKAF